MSLFPIGKELKALISKQTQQTSDAEEDEEDEDKMEESFSSVDEAKKSQDNSKCLLFYHTPNISAYI